MLGGFPVTIVAAGAIAELGAGRVILDQWPGRQAGSQAIGFRSELAPGVTVCCRAHPPNDVPRPCSSLARVASCLRTC